jgi:hypothetical protein
MKVPFLFSKLLNMFQLPFDLQGFIFQFDPTFRNIYHDCIDYIKTIRARKIFHLLENTKEWKNIKFKPFQITYFLHYKYHLMNIQELTYNCFRVTDYNTCTGSFKIYLIDF